MYLSVIIDNHTAAAWRYSSYIMIVKLTKVKSVSLSAITASLVLTAANLKNEQPLTLWANVTQTPVKNFTNKKRPVNLAKSYNQDGGRTGKRGDGRKDKV